MVRLFNKSKSPPRQQRKGVSSIEAKSKKNTKNLPSRDSATQSSSKETTTDDNGPQFASIFDDPKLKNGYQLMTKAAKKAGFGQCFFARHRSTGDIVMIMAIQNEFMNKFKADLTDPSKLKSLMTSVDPSLKGLREMIEMSTSTALILDLDMNMNAPKATSYEAKTISDNTSVMTEMSEPFDNFGSWLKYWFCGAPSTHLLCNAHIGDAPHALTAIPEYSDENTDFSNVKNTRRGLKQKRSFGENGKESRNPGSDARSVSAVSRIVDIDDATTVALSKRISQQQSKVRSRKNSAKDFRNIAAGFPSIDATLHSIFSMDSNSVPPEEDWFSMLDEMLAFDLKQ